MNAKYQIVGGEVFFPGERTFRKVDIEIENGIIAKIAENLQPQDGFERIEAGGRIISPGLIDLHAHLREPGREDTENLESGAWTALAGGFTTVCAMPNTDPPLDSREQASFIRNRSEQLGLARIMPVGTITKSRKGEEISEYALLKEGGVVAVSDDGDWVRSSEVMRRALEYAGMLGLPVITHAEDPAMCENGVMNEGKVSTLLGFRTRPSVAEEIAIRRDIALAEYTGSHLHIAHISTENGVEYVRKARAQGIKVTSEVTPHHLLLTDESMSSFDSNFKVNPPLRTQKDRDALVEGILDGTIQAIATDHAPHSVEEKEQELDIAPSGMTGLQTALPVLWEKMVDTGILKPELLLELFTGGPASVIGEEIALAQGSRANLIIFNPDTRWVFDAETNRSRSRNSPWFGKSLKGKVEQVFLVNNRFAF